MVDASITEKKVSCLEFPTFTIFHKKIRFKKLCKVKTLKSQVGFELMT